MPEFIKRYILIDDDPINNTINRLFIKKTIGEAEIVSFTDAKKGLEYLGNEFANTETNLKAVLFLDINMPEISGWDFLKLYEEIAEFVKQRIQIYILSSSISIQDLERAKANKNVCAFISKPLGKDKLLQIDRY